MNAHQEERRLSREGAVFGAAAGGAGVFSRPRPRDPDIVQASVEANGPRREVAGMRIRPSARPGDRWPAGPSPEAIVALVRSFVVAHLARRLDATILAGAAGVGEQVLRHAVHVRTGLRLRQFVQDVRLDQARLWLSSDREWRSREQLAAALGFGSSAVFGRAYARRFGETMTQTRRRAVLAGESVGGKVSRDVVM